MSTMVKPSIQIPVVCFIPKPESPLRCTELQADHPPEHFHCYSRESWPREEGETQ